MTKVELTMSGVGRIESIKLDGHEVGQGVHAFQLNGEAGDLAQLTLELPIFDVSTSVNHVKVIIPDATADVLRLLGWTPPGDGAPHPWQEYNQHGNTCHHPGCRMSEEEHAAPALDACNNPRCDCQRSDRQ